MPKPLSKVAIGWLIATLAVAACGLFFRLYPVTFYPQFEAQNKAELVVYSRIRKIIEQKIDNNYAQIPSEKRAEIKKTVFENTLIDDELQLKQAIGTLKKTLLEQRQRSNRNYLLAADPYYYLALTRNLIQTGKIADQIQGGKYFNEKMLAPLGHWYPFDLHAYTGFALYRLWSLFEADLQLEKAVAWVPPLLALICALLFMWICARILKTSPFVAGLAALYLSLCPIFLKRTLIGFYDTDAYNILFPLLIFVGIVKLFTGNRTFRRRLVTLLVITGILVLYANMWRGWMLVHMITIGCMIFLIGTNRLTKAIAMPFQLSLGLAIGVSVIPFLGLSLIWGSGLSMLTQHSLQLAQDFMAPSFKLWPDVFLIVGELKHLKTFEMAKFLGGFIFVGIASGGVVWQLLHERRHGHISMTTLYVLSMLILCVLAGKHVERLTLFIVIPTALGIAYFMQRLTHFMSEFVSQSASLKPLKPLALIIVAASSMAMIFSEAHAITYFQHPIFNPTWDRATEVLRTQTDPESIVTSWWSPGHFITSKGERRVTIDGATQNTPQAYWVANLFLEGSERKALSVLRMLNTSGNKALERLVASGLKLSEAVERLHTILPLKRSEALKLVPDVPDVLEYTHGPKPPPAYLFIYNDMVQKAMGLEFVGNWDFEKAEGFRDFTQEQPEKINKNVLKRASRANVRLLWTISGGPWMQDEEAFQRQKNGSEVRFSNGLTLDLATKLATLESEKFGNGIPKSVFWLEAGQLIEKELPGANLIFSALLLEDRTVQDEKEVVTYRTVLADPRLIRSILFQMYYLKAESLAYLKSLYIEESVDTRTRIQIYAVDWDAFLKDFE